MKLDTNKDEAVPDLLCRQSLALLIVLAFLGAHPRSAQCGVKFSVVNDDSTGVPPAIRRWKEETKNKWIWGVAVWDQNGDGRADLILTSHHQNAGSRFLNGNGDGTFSDVTASLGLASNVLPHEYRPVVMDVNGDGRPDLLHATHGKGRVVINLGETLELGGVTTGLLSKNGHTTDLNGDGVPDFYAYARSFGVATEMRYLNDGAGNFELTTSPPVMPMLPEELQAKLAALAIDKSKPNRYCAPKLFPMDEGKRLVVQYAGSYSAAVNTFGRYLTRMPDGVTYRDDTEEVGIPGKLVPLAVRDLTGDGLDDVVCGYGEHSGLYVQQPPRPPLPKGGTAAPVFTLANDFGTNDGKRRAGLLDNTQTPYLPEVHEFDFDKDGDSDLLLTTMRLGRLEVWENDGGEYSKVLRAHHWDAEGWAVADFNGDGMPDIAVGGPGPTPYWTREDGKPLQHGDTNFSLYLNASDPGER